MRMFQPHIPYNLIAFAVVAGVAGVLMGTIGTGIAAYAYSVIPAIPNLNPPLFRRNLPATCMEVFYCVNASDPNPTYFNWATPPLVDTPFGSYYADTQGAFDIGAENSTVVLEPGVYVFSVFMAVFSMDGQAEFAAVLMANEMPLFMAPAVAGDVTNTETYGLFGNISASLISFTGETRFMNKTTVHVGHLASKDVLVTPGAFWSGRQVSKF